MVKHSWLQGVVLMAIVGVSLGRAIEPAASAEAIGTKATAGTLHTVTASADVPTETVLEEPLARRPGVFTIPRGYTASQFAYQWNDPATGAQSNRLTATTVYSVSKRRYMTMLKDNPAAELPAGVYRLVVGGLSGATGALTYSLETVKAEADDSEAAALKRLWYAIVDFRNECVMHGGSGWSQFADPLVLDHLSEIDRRIWQQDADAGWSYFFSLAMFDLGRPTTDNPVVGFYHPWSDVWLFTQWEVRPTARIVSIELLSGEHVRQRGKLPLDLRIDWLQRDGFRVEQLSRSVVDNLREFQQVVYEKPSWRDALQLNDRTFESQEFSDWVVTMQLTRAWLRAGELAFGASAFDERKPMPRVLGQLVSSSGRFIETGKSGDIASLVGSAVGTHPSTAETIRRLPRDTFGRFSPVYWLSDGQSAQVYLALERNPDFCLALTYEQTSGELRLDRIDFVHFPSVAKVMLKNGSQ